jgi:transcriptional regulator with XRE-family HTH domain
MTGLPAMQLKNARQIGALIRERRTHAGWSQAKLAERVGVSRLWLIHLEQGKETAQIRLVLRALKELRITLEASLPAESRRQR